MSFLDDVGKKIAQTSKDAAQKVKDITETVKLNGLISDEESRIKDLFAQIGNAYYETYGSAPEQKFLEYVAGINAAKAKIADCKEQIGQLKGIVKCSKCGGDVQPGVPFCTGCGNKIEQVAAPGAGKCSACGNELAVGAAFCIGCGNKTQSPGQRNEVSGGTVPAQMVNVPYTKKEYGTEGKSAPGGIMCGIFGGIIGAILGIPGSYYFQAEAIRVKFGGVGDYVSRIPKFFTGITEIGDPWELGIPQNFIFGVAVFLVVGVILGVLYARIPAKK